MNFGHKTPPHNLFGWLEAATYDLRPAEQALERKEWREFSSANGLILKEAT